MVIPWHFSDNRVYRDLGGPVLTTEEKLDSLVAAGTALPRSHVDIQRCDTGLKIVSQKIIVEADAVRIISVPINRQDQIRFARAKILTNIATVLGRSWQSLRPFNCFCFNNHVVIELAEIPHILLRVCVGQLFHFFKNAPNFFAFVHCKNIYPEVSDRTRLALPALCDLTANFSFSL